MILNTIGFLLARRPSRTIYVCTKSPNIWLSYFFYIPCSLLLAKLLFTINGTPLELGDNVGLAFVVSTSLSSVGLTYLCISVSLEWLWCVKMGLSLVWIGKTYLAAVIFVLSNDCSSVVSDITVNWRSNSAEFRFDFFGLPSGDVSEKKVTMSISKKYFVMSLSVSWLGILQ